MNNEGISLSALQWRIRELQSMMEENEDQIKKLEGAAVKLEGRLQEAWDWMHAVENDGSYGERREPGHATTTIKLPTFGDADKLQQAIADRGKVIAGQFDEKTAKDARINRARDDAQSAIDEIAAMVGRGDV